MNFQVFSTSKRKLERQIQLLNVKIFEVKTRFLQESEWVMLSSTLRVLLNELMVYSHSNEYI